MSLIACRQILAVARILLKFLPDFLNSTVRFALSPSQINVISVILIVIGSALQIKVLYSFSTTYLLVQLRYYLNLKREQ